MKLPVLCGSEILMGAIDLVFCFIFLEWNFWWFTPPALVSPLNLEGMQSQVLYLQSQPIDTCSYLHIGHSFFLSRISAVWVSLKTLLLNQHIGITLHWLSPKINSLLVSQNVNAKLLHSQKKPSREWILAAKAFSSLFFFFKRENRLLWIFIAKKGFLLFLPFPFLYKQCMYVALLSNTGRASV